MFSQTLEYSLRAVAMLAGDPETARTTREIAEVTKIPQAYLSKVLQELRRAGIVQSQAGARGGVRLVRDPEELTILEVVNAVDPVARIRECPLGLASHGVRLCPLHKRLDSAMEMVEDAFAKTTLAEVLAEPTESIPLCDFPSPGSKD